MASLLDDSVNVLRPLSNDAVIRPPSVNSKVFAKLINNIHTDFAIISYSNRVLVIVTQCAKIGNLFSIRQDSPQKNGITSLSPLFIYEVNCILGPDTEEATQAVRSLVEKLDIPKPVLLSLTIPSLDHSTVNQLAEAIIEHKCW